ncbi:lamin tail domain-containing protein [Halorientalis sp.]|uniref:lamin tail domain-containing protein n=1 Tax=Halorientalis sp. TaxID=1931229 RepID=UPI0026161114|nr:lamin tail domain-containing protein [Halorientalis sp.]
MDRAVVVAVVVALTVTSGCLGLSPGGSPTPGTPAPPTDADLANSYAVTVTGVVDGDTVKIRYRNGTEDTVRLLGVDTPETSGENDPAEFGGVPETAAGRACLQAAGHDATRAMTQRLLGETVTIGIDAESDRRGYYGRLLGYVYQDGENVNGWLLAAGHARVYDSQFTERGAFDTAERRARGNSTGVWTCAADDPTTPVVTTGTPVADGGTADGGPFWVVTVHADAAGDDRENLNDEFVVFGNRGETALDLSGWTVTDDADHTYTLPPGTALEPGTQLTLRTGDGTDSATTLYWWRGAPVWNNGGDTVTVTDRRGRLRGQRTYD